MASSLLSGEPTKFKPGVQLWPLECCDCGLVHLVVLEISKNGVVITFYRDDHATQKARKRRRRKR